MGADSYDQCPKCLKQAQAAQAARETAVDAAYGQVSLSQFDLMRDEVDRERVKLEKFPQTWAQRYDIDGASEGLVTISYRGSCRVCNTSVEFDSIHEIPGL
jgi:hypothetical protein